MTVWFGHKYHPSKPIEQLTIKIHSKVVTLENSVKSMCSKVTFLCVFVFSYSMSSVGLFPSFETLRE